MIIEGKEEEVGCGAEEVMYSFKSEDLFGDSFVCEDEVRNGGGVCKGTNGASYGGAEAIKCGGVSGGENSSRPRSRSAQTRWRLGRPPKGVVTFGYISEGTNVCCVRAYFMGGQQRDRVGQGGKESFKARTRKHKKSWSLPAPALWKEKQGGEVDKVDKVVELEDGVDAKGGGGEGNNKCGVSVTVTVKKVKSIASGTVERKQSEDTGVNQQSEGTGVQQQSEATGVSQSEGCGVSSSSITSGTGVSTRSEGCQAYSICGVRGLMVSSIGAGARIHDTVCKRVSGFNGGAGIRKGNMISAAASVKGERERRNICKGSGSSSCGARERASCNVCGEVDGDFEEKVVEFVCGSGHCKVGSTCSDEHEDSDYLFGRNRVRSSHNKTAGREGSGKCEASFGKCGENGRSHKSNMATKVGAKINSVEGSEAGDWEALRARTKTAVAAVITSEVKCEASGVGLPSMESDTAECDSEACGACIFSRDIVVNTVGCETRQGRDGNRSRKGHLSAVKWSGAKLRRSVGFRCVELRNAAEQWAKQRTSAKKANVSTVGRHSVFELAGARKME